MSCIIVMGPPGVGKGTQAALLASDLGVPHITTGALLRDEVERGSELGKNLAHTVAAGEFVSDAITSELLRVRLAAPDALSGFILDGYPRTLAQVDVLDRILAGRHQAVESVVLFEARDTTLLSRIAGRGTDGRSDDRAEIILHRLDLYRARTAPVAAVYEARGVLHHLNAGGTKNDVAAAVSDRLQLQAVNR